MPIKEWFTNFGIGSYIDIVIVQLKHFLNNMVNLFRCMYRFA